MNLFPRSALGATPVALALTLAISVGASAQVATLVSPDESPEPEAVEAVLEFEDQSDALLAFAECMRENGIDMDDPQAGGTGLRAFFGAGPGADGDGIDRRSEAFRSAQQACDMYLEASRPELDPEAEQERLETQLALAACIRENGFEQYPDPAVDANGRLQRAGGREFQDIGIDRRSEEFQAVIATCRDETGIEGGPGLGGGFGPGSGNGGD